MQTRHDDHKSLQPHADTDDERNHPQHEQVRAHLLEPEKLRRDDVAENQRPVIKRVWTVHAVPDHEALVTVAAVPPKERFHDVAVADDQSGRQHHLRHVVHVAHGDEAFEAVEPSQRNRQQQNHREAGVDRAGNEVRWKDRRVPTGNDADREVETDDRVH